MTGMSSRPALRLFAAVAATVAGALAGAPAADAKARALPRDAQLRACVASAITQKRVKIVQADVTYTCSGRTAQRWYAALPGGRLVDDGPRGRFHSRYHDWPGYCAQRLADADGTPNPYFICEVELSRR